MTMWEAFALKKPLLCRHIVLIIWTFIVFSVVYEGGGGMLTMYGWGNTGIG